MAVGRSPLGVGKLPCLGHQLPSRHVRRVRGQRNADNSAIAMPALCRHFFFIKEVLFQRAWHQHVTVHRAGVWTARVIFGNIGLITIILRCSGRWNNV